MHIILEDIDEDIVQEDKKVEYIGKITQADVNRMKKIKRFSISNGCFFQLTRNNNRNKNWPDKIMSCVLEKQEAEAM